MNINFTVTFLLMLGVTSPHLAGAGSEATEPALPVRIEAAQPVVESRAGLPVIQIATEAQSSASGASSSFAALANQEAAPTAILANLGQSVKVSGRLVGIVQDDFTHRMSSTTWFLDLGGVKKTLTFSQPPDYRLSGAGIEVNGVSQKDAIAVISYQVHKLALTTKDRNIGPVGPQSMAVILVTQPSYPSLPSTFTTDAVNSLFFNTTGSSLNTFWQASSRGKTSLKGHVFGPFALTKEYGCAFSGMDAEAINLAAVASGLDISQFSRYSIVFASGPCSFAGEGTIGQGGSVQVPGQTTTTENSVQWIPTGTTGISTPQDLLGVIAHESGHNLGLNHANSLVNGSAPLGPLDDPGTSTEYGDPFSVMGSGLYGADWDYSAEHKVSELGWMAAGDYQEVTASSTITIRPYEIQAAA